ncbi:MAG TPA: DUF1289 domain-containing protein [Thiotrichaceae bacterium]|jgi:predicted Fe-S protein YdhL (DUF1289 family)|nr:DUF1289 domain-containing protein [Thiotrichaceae bacterium]HIM09085.1 DUF1289 domain-containing protein [Gammaproteobacteria bacterium]
MTDEVENIQSPCVRNCCLNEDDICLGCRRSLSEIIAWGPASNEERELILLHAKKRETSKGN